MTEPSQYFKGRTVQEQMDEVIGYVDTRAAEVATTAIASDVAQVHQDMLDADADAQAAAASAAAAAGTLANAVKKTGEASQSIAGDIAVSGDLSGGTVTVPTPVNNTDAASKKYVDDQDALLIPITDINQYAVGLTGNQSPIAGNKEFSGRVDTATFRARTLVEASAGTGNNAQWRVVGKITGLSGSDNVRATFLALTNQSTRVMFGQIYAKNTSPSISVWIHKSFPETNIALNYDGSGNVLILMQTPYAYQTPRFFPIYVQKNDTTNATVIDYSDTTVYASSSDFPYANTVYGTFIGVDV